MKSAFGDYWVGKTELKLPENAKVFGDFENAKEAAIDLCELCENRDELEFMEECEILGDEMITDEKMLKWLA